MKKPINDEATIKAMTAWLAGYPKFRGIVVLFDASDGTITDLANVDIQEALMFANAYKAFIDMKAGVQVNMIPLDAIPDEDIAAHTDGHTCPCSIAELKDVADYITAPGHTLEGLLMMIEHRLAQALGET